MLKENLYIFLIKNLRIKKPEYIYINIILIKDRYPPLSKEYIDALETLFPYLLLSEFKMNLSA